VSPVGTIVELQEFNVASRFHVRISKDYLVFSAGHFITYDGDVCERLHGHNYRVTAEVAGPLDENHYVVDFIALRDTLRAIVDELDHHMLLPTEHPLIRVTANEREVEATFRDRRWVFPRGDCILLPVPNTTSELLARYIAQRLSDDLAVLTGSRPEQVRIEVDECFGNVAVCDLGTEAD
jgi:6-pyruvoyltetrahydropterin/6-carboxytetrahydropterin synthase